MYFLTPVPEEKASDEVRQIYEDIKHVFAIETVPLLFQYIANYPEYLTYIWEQMRHNLQASTFRTSTDSIEDFGQKAIHEIYHPSAEMTQFITTLHPQEKEQIAPTAVQLEDLNTKLMILTIGVRESIKGIQVGVQKIQDYADPWATARAAHIDTYHDKAHDLYTTSGNTLLAPLFGNKQLIVSHYPKFFELIAREMEKLITTEAFLLTRVTLEQQGLQAVSQFSVPFECSFQDLLRMIGNRPYADELVHLLTVTFPSQFPRLFLTSIVMKQLLKMDQTNAIANT